MPFESIVDFKPETVRAVGRGQPSEAYGLFKEAVVVLVATGVEAPLVEVGFLAPAAVLDPEDEVGVVAATDDDGDFDVLLVAGAGVVEDFLVVDEEVVVVEVLSFAAVERQPRS